jgi:hypothetical protein
MKRSIKLKRARSSCPVDSENSSSIAHLLRRKSDWMGYKGVFGVENNQNHEVFCAAPYSGFGNKKQKNKLKVGVRNFKKELYWCYQLVCRISDTKGKRTIFISYATLIVSEPHW